MKVLVVASETCRNIAVYSNNIANVIEQLNENDSVDILNINDEDEGDHTIIKGEIASYINCAKQINKDYDVCLLQHHPKAFGGNEGNYILAFLNNITIPVITTFHGINNNPSNAEKEVVRSISSMSYRVLAFSQIAIEFLDHYYKVSRELIGQTDFFVPSFIELTKEELLSALEIQSQHLFLSCGEMNSTYGYETIINALPIIFNHFPDSKLCIVNTGNNESAYQNELLRLARKRGVQDQVIIKNIRDIDISLAQLMNGADVFISAKNNESLLNNPILSQAVCSGAAIIATPTWFAKEILDDQKGMLFAFKSSNELSQQLIALLRNTKERQQYKNNALLYAAQNSSAVVGKFYHELIEKSIHHKTLKKEDAIACELLPSLNLKHLESLVDNTGVLNHSIFDIVSRINGYDMLSNSMALQVFNKAYQVSGKDCYKDYMSVCLSFICGMKSDDGRWVSDMSYNRALKDKVSDAGLSYAVLALSELYTSDCSAGLKDIAYNCLIDIALNHPFKELGAKATVCYGIVNVVGKDGDNPELLPFLKEWIKEIKKLFPNNSYDNWQWYAKEFSSNIGLIPLVLIKASGLMHDKELLSLAKRSLRFTEKLLTSEGMFSPKVVGIDKLGIEKGIKSNEKLSNEAYWMVAAYCELYGITGESRYLKVANNIHNWYLGDNSLSKSLYDSNDGGCFVGISGRSIMASKSAESTSCYWLSYFALLDGYIQSFVHE